MGEQRGAPKPHSLTRDALQSGFVEAMIASSGVALRVLSEEDREASLDATLQAQPAAGDVWLFAYGSLIWNPAFEFADRHPALIRGWHR